MLKDTNATCQEPIVEFSEKIKEICRLESINLKEFSDLSNIPYVSIKNYSSGRRTPAWSQIHKIADTPRFSKYRIFLLSEGLELSEEMLEMYPELRDAHKEELLDIWREISSLGLENQALSILRALSKREDE